MPSFLYLTLLTVNLLCYSKKVPQCIFFLVLISSIGSEDMFSHKSNFHLSVFPLKEVPVTGP